MTNQLNTPYGLHQNTKTKVIYIADALNHRILSYRSNISNCTIIAGGNGPGLCPSKLQSPRAIYHDFISNDLLITNADSHTVVRWSLDSNSCRIIAGNVSGAVGNSSTHLFTPVDVKLDPMGNMYVADRYNNRIQFFFANQNEGITIAGITSIEGTNSSLLRSPSGIGLDSQLNLYIVDHWNSRIQKFLRY